MEIRELEQKMAEPGFYDQRAVAQPTIDRHQALMWQVGDLMHQWEELQSVDDARREELGAAARKAVASLSWERAARETVAVYKSVL